MPPPSRRAAAQPPAVTPIAFARAIAAAYQRRGLAPQAALRFAQITPAQLRQPHGRITARQFEMLASAAMRELDDESLGAFARPLPWGSYGMLARASLGAPQLGVALKRWCRHHALIADDLALAVGVQGADASISLRERRPLPEAQRELAITFVLRNIHGLACWYVDSRIPLHAARLPFGAPPHADAYAHMFPGPVAFDAPWAELRFDARYLALPLRRDDAALSQMLQRALAVPVLQYRRDRLLVAQVRQALAAEPQLGQGAEQIAARLNVSARTLHRQLKEEGASLQQLKDEIRLAQARDLLWRTSRPVKQVAAAVGFRSEKSFARAFRQWVGLSPAAFRTAGQAGAPQSAAAAAATDASSVRAT